MTNIPCKSVLIIGMGLIGSSIARVIKEKKIADKIFALENDNKNIKISNDLNIVDEIQNDLKNFKLQFD